MNKVSRHNFDLDRVGLKRQVLLQEKVKSSLVRAGVYCCGDTAVV